jgi:hypothetical protein
MTQIERAQFELELLKNSDNAWWLESKLDRFFADNKTIEFITLHGNYIVELAEKKADYQTLDYREGIEWSVTGKMFLKRYIYRCLELLSIPTISPKAKSPTLDPADEFNEIQIAIKHG